MANELGELIKSRKKNEMLNAAVGVATDEIARLEQENAELRDLLQQQREKIVELYSIGQFKVRVDVSEVLTKSEELLKEND